MQSTDVKIAVTLYLYVDTVISWRGIFSCLSTKRKTTLWCCLRNYSTQYKSVGTVVSISETGLLECRAVIINSYLPRLNIKRLRRLGLV